MLIEIVVIYGHRALIVLSLFCISDNKKNCEEICLVMYLSTSFLLHLQSAESDNQNFGKKASEFNEHNIL